jgi:hypothetical protein
MFSKLKESLTGNTFSDDDDEVQDAVKTWLREQAGDFHDAGIKKTRTGSLCALRSMVTVLKCKYRCVVNVLQRIQKKNALQNIFWTLYLYFPKNLFVYRNETFILNTFISTKLHGVTVVTAVKTSHPHF